MTTYTRSARHQARISLRWLAWRINRILALAVLLALLLPGVATAAPRCPGGGQVDGRGRCVYVWRGATCARVGGLVLCVTPRQVGQVQP